MCFLNSYFEKHFTKLIHHWHFFYLGSGHIYYTGWLINEKNWVCTWNSFNNDTKNNYYVYKNVFNPSAHLYKSYPISILYVF